MAPVIPQAQGYRTKSDRRRKRNHGEDTGDGAQQDGVRSGYQGVDAGHDGALGNGHEDDAIHCGPDGGDDTGEQGNHSGAEQAPRCIGHILSETLPIQADKEQGEQREAQRHGAMQDLQSQSAGPLQH